MRIFHLLTFFVFIPVAGWAQRVTFGVEGGFPTQPPLGGPASTTAFQVGPTVTIRIFSGLSVESGVQFHRMGERQQSFTILGPDPSVDFGSYQWRGRAIEIPILLKYSFLSEHRSWRPFVSAGPAIRRTSIDFTSYRTILSGSQLTNISGNSLARGNAVDWKVDPEAGAGVTFRAGRIYIEPQFRYSYWSAGKNSEIVKNQAHFLLGFRF